MKQMLKQVTVLTLFAAGFTLLAYAEEQPKIEEQWQIRLMPYFWMPKMNATSTVNGLSGTVELGFDDVLEYLDFAAMGRIEAWRGKWGLSFDGIFMNLAADGSFQGRRANFSFDLDQRLGMAEFGLMYRFHETFFGKDNQQRLAFEPYGGLRYGYLRQKVGLNIVIPGVGSAGQTLGTSEDWVEPFVGSRLILDFNETLALNVRGDAGGFGIGSASDLTWQIAGGVDYKFSDRVIFNAGYRYVKLDYSRGSGRDEFGIDLEAYGPYLGMTLLF